MSVRGVETDRTEGRPEFDAVTVDSQARRTTDSRTSYLGALGIAVLIGLAMSVQGQPIWDDPYILMRYAENVATGGGWSFNRTGQTENAVTSTLFVLILAGGRKLGAHVVPLAHVLYFASTWVLAVVTSLTLRRLGHHTAGVMAALMIAVSPALTAMWGMESSLFLCVLAGSLYSATAQWPTWVTGLLLGLLVLARPDGLVVGAILVLVFYVIDRTRRASARQWLELTIGAAVPLLGWATMALVLMDTMLPSTLEAKRAQAESGWWPGFMSPTGINTVVLLAGGTAFFAVLAMAAAAGCFAVAWRRAAWQVAVTLLAGAVAIIAIYGGVIRTPNYPWYYALPIYSMLVLAAIGIEFGLSLLSPRPRARRVVGTVVAASLIIVSLGRVIEEPVDFRDEYAYVGEWLRRNTPADATVASLEVGKIGWFSEREMVDYLGLLDSEANEHVRAGDFSWWAAHYQPDYWVTLGTGVDEEFATSPCMRAAFEPVLETATQTVYHRTRQVADASSC